MHTFRFLLIKYIVLAIYTCNMFTVTLARHVILHLFLMSNLCNFDDYLSSDSTLFKFCLQNMERGTVHYYWRFLRTRGLAHRSLWSSDPDRGFLAPWHWREDAENTGPYMIQGEQLEVIDNYDKVLFWWTFPSVCLGFSCYIHILCENVDAMEWWWDFVRSCDESSAIG